MPILFIIFLTVLILGGDFFIKPGTYFLLDGVFPPIYTFQSFFEVSIFWHLNNLFTILFGYILYSKLFLFCIVFFTGFLGYLFGNLFGNYLKLEKKETIIYPFILFLLINPFFYERTITQPGIFLGIILIGYGLYFLLKDIIIGKNIKNFIYSGIFFGLSFSLMNHGLFMIILIYILYLIFFIKNIKLFLNLVLSGFIFILINLNWLIGNFFLNTGNVLDHVNILNQENINNFPTSSISGLGEELTTLLLYGFWGEKWNHFILPNIINEKWYIAGFLVLLIIFYGFFQFIKNNKTTSIGLFLFFLGFTSYILGVGITAKWGFISQSLYDYLPFYIGLREPHKWIGIVMIVYSIFFSVGIYFIIDFFYKKLKIKYFQIFSLIIIFLFLNAWSPNIIGAFGGQLFMTNYPQAYFDFKEKKLQNNYIEDKYLILPWHGYMSCHWTQGRVIGNIMSVFFQPLHTITSDNIEVGTLYTNSQSKQSQDIETFLISKNIDILKYHKFTHIIMLEYCADFSKYNDILSDLEKKNLIKTEFKSVDITSYSIE